MLKKIKIIINIDNSTKSHIFSKIRNLEENLDISWLKSDDYSIQLAMMRMIDDDYLFEICENLKTKLKTLEPFDLILNEIAWGPNSENPKMIWLKGPKNEELINLRNLVEGSLSENPRKIENFSPHITLAKIPKRVSIDEVTFEQIDMNIALSVDGVDIVEISQKGRQKEVNLIQSISF